MNPKQYNYYGYYEKYDLGRALDVLGASRAVVMGSSLGGSVALQAAAVEPRITAVIAQSPFADLERIARERAPFFANETYIRTALRIAEQEASFHISGVSPVRDAPKIRVPVLLLHGGPGFDHSLFKPVFSTLTDIAQVVYLDHRGNGRSEHGDPAHWNLAQWGDDVRAFCEANLTGYKRPKVVEFRTELPKTPVGKILRRELRGK